jgi:hypothetical protein
VGSKSPGLLQVSLRPEIFNYCPAGGAAEFLLIWRQLRISFIIVLKFYICIWRWLHSGYLLVEYGTDVQLESYVSLNAAEFVLLQRRLSYFFLLFLDI